MNDQRSNIVFAGTIASSEHDIFIIAGFVERISAF